MAKRRAPEDLDAMEGVTSPAPKKQKSDGREELLNGRMAHERIGRQTNEGDEEGRKDDDNENSEEKDADDDDTTPAAPVRQAAPTAGYDDLYLDSIDRQVLDFDFEKLCSVSLSNINVYACLVCGRYFQGRGLKSHAYFHALDEDHHVFINMQTQRVYVLPEGYEVLSRSLDDIKFVADPRYTRGDVAQLDRRVGNKTCYTLAGKPYTPGFVGMNNIKENDYLNVVVQALAHVPPLRNFLLLDEFAATASSTSSNKSGKTSKTDLNNPNAELVKRFGLLVRKIWNSRAFKAHVSPHELLQEVALRSNRRFALTSQSDPVDFLTWFLNHLHLGLGGSRTRPGSSIIQRVFQGRVRVESEKLEAVGASAAAAVAAAAAANEAAETTQYQQPPPADAMMIDTPLPVRPGGPLPPGIASHPLHLQQYHHQPPPPGVGEPGLSSFRQPPPPGVSSGSGMFSTPPPPLPGPPGMSMIGSSSLPPPPSTFPPPPSSSMAPPPEQNQQAPSPPPLQPTSEATSTAISNIPPKPTVDVSRFLLLTLDLPAAPLFQDEQERNIIPQVPLTTLLEKYDGQSAQSARVDQGDVRRRFQLQGPLPPYLVLHMKRFSSNRFVTERNPTIVTFDPRGLNLRPYVQQGEGDSEDGEILYDLVANVVHEAERARGDDVAVDSAEERRTWKVQLRDRSGATVAATENGNGITTNDGEDKWVVAQDLFVEPVAGELLYLAESYIQIWERRRKLGVSGNGSVGKGKAAAASTNGGSKGKAR